MHYCVSCFDHPFRYNFLRKGKGRRQVPGVKEWPIERKKMRGTKKEFERSKDEFHDAERRNERD